MSGDEERWLPEPEAHDYDAAADYLSLSAPPNVVVAIVAALRAGPLVGHKAKDLLRASGLKLLPPEDAEVAKDLKKVKRGEKLSPILVVRGDLARSRAVTIADGYHRVCASYHLDENATIPCRMADLPPTTPPKPASA